MSMSGFAPEDDKNPKGPQIPPRSSQPGELVPPQVDPKPATEVAVASYRERLPSKQATQAVPGKEGTAPGRYQEVREVTSWIDVAPLLADLYSPDSKRQIRVKFPKPEAGDQKGEITQMEQTQIRKFLRENHGKPIAEIQTALAKKLENSLSFLAFKVEHYPITIESWIQANLEKVSTKPNLQVTDIVTITQNENVLERLKARDIQATLSETPATKKIEVVFEAKNSDLKALAGGLQLCQKLGLWGDRPARIWAVHSEENAVNPRRDLSENGKESCAITNVPLKHFFDEHAKEEHLPVRGAADGMLSAGVGGVTERITALRADLDKQNPSIQTLADGIEELKKRLTEVQGDPKAIAEISEEITKKTAEHKQLTDAEQAAKKRLREDLEALEKEHQSIVSRLSEEDRELRDSEDLILDYSEEVALRDEGGEQSTASGEKGSSGAKASDQTGLWKRAKKKFGFK